MNRVRTLLVMERFLARVVSAPGAFVLKGGLALELRLQRARTTRDVDLRGTGDPEGFEVRLQRACAARPAPDDHLEFRIQPHSSGEIAGEGVAYEGRRFRVSTSLAGRPYADAFGVDVAIADPMSSAPDTLVGTDFFERYGIPRVQVLAYPLPAHIAEKIHAYTLPRERANSRMKDLVDLALLAGVPSLDDGAIRTAIEATFAFRGSHPVPTVLPEPPVDWGRRYPKLQEDERLQWAALADVLTVARARFDPILGRDR